MDPKAAIRQLVDAICVHDMERAQEYLDDLAEWESKGGFMPEHAAVIFARVAIPAFE